MFTVNKISKDVVAVTYDSANVYLRKSGKKYYGTEKSAVKVTEDKVIIYKKVLDEFGLKIEIVE